MYAFGFTCLFNCVYCLSHVELWHFELYSELHFNFNYSKSWETPKGLLACYGNKRYTAHIMGLFNITIGLFSTLQEAKLC